MNACTSSCGFCGACTASWERENEHEFEPLTPFDEMDATLKDLRERQEAQRGAQFDAYVRKAS